LDPAPRPTDHVDYAGTDPHPATLDRVGTTGPGAGGGVDRITTGAAGEVVVGGDAGDTVQAANGDNVVVGDNGRVSLFGGKLLSILSTDTGADGPTHGGADSITTGGGSDTVVGGLAGDTIVAGDGNNVVFGDSAEL